MRPTKKSGAKISPPQIDKPDILWYNADMNDIVFAGSPRERGGHRHKGYEVICALAPGEIKTAEGAYPVKRGDAAVIPRQIEHSDPADCLSVIMENVLLPVVGVCVISGEGAEDIAWVCARAKKCCEGGAPKRQVLLDGLGALLRAFIAAYCGVNDYSPAVKYVLAEIDKGISDGAFSLENAMRALPLNYDYVRKLFKKETGQTPHECLTAKRMSLAREIILSGITNRYSNYTVSQIAEMCGYSEPLYFSRVFKKYYGVSPTEYAAKNK